MLKDRYVIELVDTKNHDIQDQNKLYFIRSFFFSYTENIKRKFD